MFKVFKYAFSMDPTPLEIPGKVVHFGHDPQGVLCVWAEVPQTPPKPLPMLVQVYGTGHQITNGAIHLGSVTHGPYVWHLYDVTAVVARKDGA